MLRATAEDRQLIHDLNERTSSGLELLGRAASGKLGGALFVRWPGGRPGVVTTFQGSSAEARQLASVINELHRRGLAVPRHELVADLADRVVIVQQRLPADSPRAFSKTQVDAIWDINERFAGAAGGLRLPDLIEWFGPAEHSLPELRREADAGARDVLNEIAASIRGNTHRLSGDDVVHVDLNAANVLFDQHERATGVVDWNLGAYRGNRHAALVHTRFDREWFVRRTDSDRQETEAAAYLDEILADRIEPDELRVHWAFWLLHHLSQAFRHGAGDVIEWQLDLARSRLG